MYRKGRRDGISLDTQDTQDTGRGIGRARGALDGETCYPQNGEWYRNLSAEEERALGTRIQAGGPDAEAAIKEFAGHNIRLVIKVALRFYPIGMTYSDLVGYGYIGLIRAAKTFDPNRGCRFSTYAMHWIKQSIKRAQKDNSRIIRIPIFTQDIIIKILRGREVILHKYIQDKISEIMNGKLNVSTFGVLEEYGDDNAHSGKRTKSMSMADAVADGKQSVIENLQDQEEKNLLHKIIERILTPNERLTIRLRFFKDLTLESIGIRMGYSRERIRQFEVSAIAKLKKYYLTHNING